MKRDQFRSNINELLAKRLKFKQECIPVGCVPAAH